MGGLHASLDDSPTCSMFIETGQSAAPKKNDSNSMTDALTQAAVANSSALSPRPSSQTTLGSPGKLTESRSKCYKQLSEINNLKVSGVLTEEGTLRKKKQSCFEET